MKPTIRPAVKADAPAILALIHKIAAYEQLAHEVENTVERIEERLFCDKPLVHALLIEADNQAIGYAIYFYNYSTFTGKHGLYLEDFYIDKAFRGEGIGQEVFAQLKQIAKEQNCGRMEWMVLDWNAPAIRFYDLQQAKPMEGWTVYRLTEEQF